MAAAPVVAERRSVVIWEVRRVIVASLPQVVLFPLISRILREKRLFDLILFTVSGDSGQTVPGSYGCANDFTAFLGALAFTRPVEQLMLRSVPLPSLLFWLSQPKASSLVEATPPAEEMRATSACRLMAIAVSEEMLYKDNCPLVGAGLMYTLPYLPQVPFSVAYMNLCVWRDAAKVPESWLVGTRLMFIHISEESGFLPVAEGHPVLLDASTTEVLCDIEMLILPHSLRGFQLHTAFAPAPQCE